MGNCLVTKLKGTVDNDMLLDFGFQGIKYNYNGDIDVTLLLPESGNNKSIKLKGDGYFISGGNNVGKIINRTVTPNVASVDKIHANGDVLLELENGVYENNTREIRFNNIDASALPVFDSSVLPLIYNGVKRSRQNNTYYCQKIKGKLSDIITGVPFANIGIRPSSLSPEFVGDIGEIDFGSNSIWPYNFLIYNCPNVYGSLNTFLDNLAVAVARNLPDGQTTTKTVSFDLRNTGIFYNGSLVSATFTKTFIIHQDGSWEEYTT